VPASYNLSPSSSLTRHYYALQSKYEISPHRVLCSSSSVLLHVYVFLIVLPVPYFLYYVTTACDLINKGITV